MISLRRQRIQVKPIAGVGDSLRVKPIGRVEADEVAFADVLRETMDLARKASQERAHCEGSEIAHDEARKNDKAKISADEPAASGKVIVKGWSPTDDGGMDLHDQLESLLNKKSVLIGIA